VITCIGIDLAWSPRNPTGAAVLSGTAQGGTLADVTTLRDDGEIVAYIAQHARTDTVLVAVDAPLVVPNSAGQRPGEAELNRVFARYAAGAYPANRRLLARDGVVHGEALVAALAAHGFVHAPAIAAHVPARQVTEVYPHPAMVALFGLERTLCYKARRRSRAERLAAWQQYQQHLRGLAAAEPALQGHEALLAQDVAALRGRALKQYEDQVDALLCAYIALYAFRWGAARCRTFGTLEAGYIFTPCPAGLR
jgi:predicted RNase H-like nuclease